ncbi:MAG TPA: DUF3667 domain-containing protein [Longimicrobium sp.]|nr:DUF3667 domain-containing protein [Longimicrobium sp.]
MMLEVVDDQFSVNSALPRSAKALFLRPGELTREYMAGRIVRYIPPFRLYLVCSVVFFLVLSLVPDLNPMRNVIRVDAARSDSAGAAAPAAERPAAAPADSNWADDISIRSPNAALDSLASQRLRELGRLPPQEAFRRVSAAFLQHAPQMMFLLLPLFAFLLKVLYFRRKRFYVEHFIFALHIHSFTYVVLTAMVLLPAWTHPILNVWLMIYVFLAMRRVYGQGLFRTTIKYVTLGMSYLTILSVASVVTIVLSIAFM